MGKMTLSQIAEAFWAKVEKTDYCWLWNAFRDKGGYGIFQGWRASRLVYFWLVSDFPDELSVCHHCDNPACVRPDHLFIGDDVANTEDKCKKGRQVKNKGESNPRSLLTEEIVRQIRLNPPPKRGICKRARELGISQGAMMHVIKGRSWRHVEL